ncbi:MAG: hypothetical protein AAF639_28670 [Chloroflexota bacterium]
MTRQHLCLTLLLLAHLVVTAAFSVLNPLGEAPDEADHWAYVVHIARERELPTGPRVTQSKHPPLYHAAAALVSHFGTPHNTFLRSNPDVQIIDDPLVSPNFFIHTTREDFPWQGEVLSFHAARLWSVLLSTLTVWATFVLGRMAFPHQPMVAWIGAVLLAFLPEFAFIGGSINNDNGIALFGTLSLIAAIRMMQPVNALAQLWWIPLAIGGALLTKTSALGLWPAISIAIVWGGIRLLPGKGNTKSGTPNRPHPLPESVLRKLLSQATRLHLWAFGGGVLIASPWLWRNLQLYGDPLGVAMARQTIDLRTTAWTMADTWWLLRGWFYSSVGKFGGAGHIPLSTWIYVGYGVIGIIALMGLLLYAWQQIRRPNGASTVILLTALVGVAGGMWQYSLIALGTDQGRLLYPAIAPIMLLIGLGLATLCPKRHVNSIVMVLVGWGGIAVIASMLLVLLPTFAPLPSETSPIRTEETPILQYEELNLLGWSSGSESADANPILYWQVSQETARDLRTVVRILAHDDGVIWEKRRSPGRGLLSTDHWTVDRIVTDVYDVAWPEWVAPGEYRLVVGVQPYDEPLIWPTPLSLETQIENEMVVLGIVEKR